MSNFGSYVKALRKAFTHLTEEPQFMAYMTKRDVKPLVILLIHEEGGCVKIDTSSFLFFLYLVYDIIRYLLQLCC